MAGGKKILVVDDEESIRNFLADFLRSNKYIVECAMNGRECMSLLKQSPIDIIITDLIMPHVEGIDTIIMVRKIYPHIRIIAMSGIGFRDSYLQLALDSGAHTILPKPFRPDDILQALKRVEDEATA